MNDATLAELGWYFRDSSLACEATVLLGSLPWSADLERLDARTFSVDAITRTSAIRRRLASLPTPHADVLAAMFEERQWPPRVTSLFSWPGVATRTLAAQYALAIEGEASGDFHAPRAGEPFKRPKASPDGMLAYLSGLTDKRAVVRAIREETSRRVRDALDAYEAAAPRARKRRAA